LFILDYLVTEPPLDWSHAMLALRPNCECCNTDLAADAANARICSFECTFCAECVAHRLPGGRCPNRPAEKLAKFPASVQRVSKAHAGCAASSPVNG
jgi:uncharacterized protein